MKKLIKIPVVFGLTATLASFAQAQEFNPYQFSGTCGSQGVWTQKALQQTSQIRAILTKLKNDSNCQDLGKRVSEKLADIDKQVSSIDGDLASRAQYQRAQLPQEIGALRSFLAGEPSLRSSVLNTMFGKMIDASRGTAEPILDAQNAIQQSADPKSPDVMAKSMSSLIERVNGASTESLRMFNEAIDSLPALQECLIEPNTTGQLMAAFVQFTSSMASGGQSGSLMAQTVSKLANYARTKKFSKALRQLNNSDFMPSLACLLEMTSENYCAARDARIMFNEMNGGYVVEKTSSGGLRLKPKEDINAKLSNMKTPLAGYYILSQNVPIITDWLQKIQLGAEPRLKTDALQKNEPINEIAKHQSRVNELRALVNSQRESILAYTDVREKQLGVVKLLKDLTGSIVGSRDFDNGGQNFFTLSTAPLDIPFYMLGIPTPDEVKPRSVGFPATYDQWLDANYLNIPEFNSPEVLAQKIANNLDKLIQRADVSALAFYNKWFIVDKVAIVNSALLGVNYSAKSSIQNIITYLQAVEKKNDSLSGNASLSLILKDTRYRLKKVMDRFDALEQFAKKANAQTSEADMEQIRVLSEDLIREVYSEFMVMLAKSGWLASRMADIVFADFQIMKQAGIGLDPYIEELYSASGRTLVDQIVRMSEGNPANLQSDLAMGMTLSKGNLAAIETGLSQSYLDQIVRLEHIIRGFKKMTGTSQWILSHPESSRWLPSYEPIPGRNSISNSTIGMTISGVWRGYLGSFGDVKRGWNYINTIMLPSETLQSDDEFGSAKILQAQMCIQTLAFSDLKPFWPLCHETVLESPFKDSLLGVGTTEDIRSKLNVIYKEKAWEDYNKSGEQSTHATNQSKRICGFRDFNRKNLVIYLTKGAGL